MTTFLVWLAAVSAQDGAGLEALYDFSSSSGPVVKDRSGKGKPVDLKIANVKAVRRSAGSLEVRGKTTIRSDKAATRIIDAIRRSGEITIEAWIRPANTKQSGPARIVTLSKNSSERNFTLGQDGEKFDVRLRTTKTSKNGLPSVSTARKSLVTKQMHVTYVRDRSGRARIYLNGKRSAEGKVAGAPSNWDGSFRLGLANEMTNDRPWQGTYYRVAVYSRALSPGEVARNFKAGAGAQPALLVRNKAAENARFFETRIAPILARRCLECHDSNVKKGRLDLSRKATALAGGKNGKVIVPGKSADSPLWEAVESNDMPKKRKPLSAEDKKLLREWIDRGAAWSLDAIDPAVYAHGQKANQIWVQRLTGEEYVETVRSAVGVDVAKEARKILPPDLRADGFSNTAYNLNVDLKHVQAYAKLAEIIVGRMDVVKFAARFSKSRKLTDKDMRKLIAEMGKWLWRGPLEEREVVSLRGISTDTATSGGGFKDAVGYVIEAMLQSPRFIYRVERQRGDGTAWPVGEYELASRVSYILWGGPPDRELMRAAEDGGLSDRGKLEAQVRRMLQDPRAIERSSRFIYEWLDLGRMDNLQPNAKRFPKWDDKLAADMRAETLAFFREVVWKQKRPLSDLLNAQVTFATPRLAAHYGIKSAGEGQSRYDLKSVKGRGGLLTQASVLTIGGEDASMVTRGLFVLHELLRGIVKDPPPGVDATPVPAKVGLSTRGVSETRIANKSCGGCHVKFEPLAFGLEKFDGLGVFREKDEHGNRLREDGVLRIPGQAKPIPYSSTSELMDLLAGSERVRETLTWKVTQFALGRPLGAADARIIGEIHKEAWKGGGTYASLITAIVTSDLVRMTRTEEEP